MIFVIAISVLCGALSVLFPMWLVSERLSRDCRKNRNGEKHENND